MLKIVGLARVRTGVVTGTAVRQAVRREAAGVWAAGSGNARCMSALAEKVYKATSELPMAEAVRYKPMNMKFTRQDVERFSDALACGLIDLGCAPGTAVACFLPECVEKNMLQLAAVKAGFVFADADKAAAATSEGVAKVLKESKAVVAVLEEADFLTLKMTVPELTSFDDKSGKPFQSESFPSLRYVIHTGFDILPGALSFQHVRVLHPQPHSPIPPASAIPDTAPLLTPFGGGKASKTLTHKDVMASGAKEWPTVAAILSKKYIEV